MSDAKEKAKEEIETYRATMEAEFQEKQKSVHRKRVRLFCRVKGLVLRRRSKSSVLKQRQRLLISSILKIF